MRSGWPKEVLDNLLEIEKRDPRACFDYSSAPGWPAGSRVDMGYAIWRPVNHSIRILLKKIMPTFSAQQKLLNSDVMRKASKFAAPDKAFEIPIPDEIRTSQHAWLKYRNA